MTHKASEARGTTFIAASGKKTTKTAVPMHRRVLPPSPTPEQIAREFNLHTEEMHEATIGSRSIPFGGPTVGVAVSLTSGQATKVTHGLNSTRAILLFLAHPTNLTSGNPTAWVSASDDNSITLSSEGTFSAIAIVGLQP